MRSLEEMEQRALRHLDGMTVNRDAMAHDVLQLVAAVRKYRNQASETSEESDFGKVFFESLVKGKK